MFHRVFGALVAFLIVLLHTWSFAQEPKSGVTDSIRSEVGLLINSGEDRQALTLCESRISMAKTRGDSAALFFLNYSIGYCYLDLGVNDSAILFFRKAYETALEEKNLSGQIKVLYQWEFAFRNVGLQDSATKYIGVIEVMVPHLKNDEDISYANGALATFYFDTGNFEKSIEYDLKELTSATQIKDTLSIVASNQNIGTTLTVIHNSESALKYFRDAQALLTKVNSPYYEGSNNYYLGDAFYQLDQIDSSIFYLQKAIPQLEQSENLNFLSSAYSKYGELLIKKNEYAASVLYFKKAIKLCRENDLQINLAESFNALGLAELSLLNYQRAFDSYKEALDVAAEIPNPQSMKDAYDGLAKSSYALGDYKSSYNYARLHEHFTDSLDNVGMKSKMEELEQKYQGEKKQQQIKLLGEQNNIQSLQLQSRQRLLIFIAVAVALLIILFVVAYRSYQLKQREKLQSVRNKIARDLHDDVGSSLSSIRMYSEAIRSQAKTQQADDILKKISDNSREIVDTMSDIVWAINPKNDSLQSMEEHMQSFAVEICASKNITPVFESEMNGTTKIPMEMRKNVFLIFKEALNNAIKYSECKNISVSLQRINHHLDLKVVDDGKGFTESGVKHGNGLINMRKRAEEIHGELTIHSEEEKGTEVKLSVRVRGA